MRTVLLGGRKAAGRLVEVDDEEYELVTQFRWCVHEMTRPNGRTNGPYAFSKIAGFMHCLIMGAKGIDHIDGNGLNNQRSNLRLATSQQNHANERKTLTHGGKPTSSHFKGVYRHKASGRWHAHITAGGDHRSLGYYSDEIEAALAYDAAARAAFGEFARLNFPEAA